MQPRLTVGILVLQSEGLVSTIRYLGFFFQTTSAGVVTKPNQITFAIGHLSRDADLVAVEVLGAFRFGSVLIQASLSWRSLERRRPNGS